MLASGADDGSVKLWNTAAIPGQASPKISNKFQPKIDVHSRGGLQSLLPLPNSNDVLVVTGHGADIRDITSGQRKAFWPDAIGRGALSPDGKLLATGTPDGKVKLWEVASGRLLAAVQAHPSGEPDISIAVAFSSDGRVVATAGFNSSASIKFWDPAASLKLIRQILTPLNGGISALGFSPDGKKLAAALKHERILIMNADGKAEELIHTGSGTIWGTIFSPDSKLLATGDEGGVISLWDVQTGRLHASLKGHTSNVRTVAFSPDGTTLASGGEDYTVRLWDVTTGQERITFNGHSNIVSSVVFSLDGGTLITGHRDGMLTLRRGIHVSEADIEVTPAEAAGQIRIVEDYSDLAWTLATDPDPQLRDGQRSLEFAEKAFAASNRKDPTILDTLAAACWNSVNLRMQSVTSKKPSPS